MSWAALAKKGQETAEASAKKLADAEKEFQTKYGKSAKSYIDEAREKAYSKASEKGGFEGRSKEGQKHATRERAEEHENTPSDVEKYHDLEEQGKSAAKSGDLKTAAKKLEEAAEKRLTYEKKVGKTDKGHADAVVYLRERSKSISDLMSGIETGDADLHAAKQTVKTFFEARGVAVPFTL